ncbi:FAD-binding domain-containing protein [Podospora conica]|nr:FAD-binding domain-containing protein [Schizothecium conicum]
MKFLPLLCVVASLAWARPSTRYWDYHVDHHSICLSTTRSAAALFSHLAAKLSPNATILLPSNPDMRTTHQRWQAHAQPTYAAVVEVATEDDVVTTVRFANTHSLPFLAVDGAHGATAALSKMHHGIAISFVRMKTVTLLPGGRLARLDPGLTNGDLVRALWAQGKQTSTGRGMCPGVTGIALGGGHGDLQGLWGRPGDQMVEARVVLADGTRVTVSERENEELWWAMRGAGHNFGIVTAMTWRVYERVERWSKVGLVFGGERLEGVFAQANGLLGRQPGGLTVYYIFLSGGVGEEAVVQIDFTFAGELSELDGFAAPFRALGPVSDQSWEGKTYMEINKLGGNDETSDLVCGKGYNRHMFGSYTKHHNITALRRVHYLFTNITNKYPGLGNLSVVFVEGYPQQGALKVPVDSTAVPYRAYPLLTAPLFTYTDPSWTDDIVATTKEIKRVLTQAEGPNELPRGYVNYGIGDEESEELYGYDKWRLEKLRRLKRRYDPDGKFGFYAPIDASLGVWWC